MNLFQLARRLFSLVSIPAVILTLLLYNYPSVKRCAFPAPHPSSRAPFRLLALGDPQLEGSTSLPDPSLPLLPNLDAYLNYRSDYSQGFPTERPSLSVTLKKVFQKDLPLLIYTYRKRLDLFGNDYYLAHIYRHLRRSLRPTHVVVLGDLLGSQWIDDGEFSWRAWRYWNRVFSSARRVEYRYTTLHGPELLKADDTSDSSPWATRIINVAGNHDIGYSGDINVARVDRFEALFGPVNWDIRFSLPSNVSSRRNPELRLVVLNSMNLDGPATDRDLQTDTYAFLNNKVIGHARPVSDRTSATILMTHIPLDKKDGICVDSSLFDYGPNGLRTQNMLSRGSTLPILEGVFGIGHEQSNGLARNGVILTGHDHEGCDVYHYLDREGDNGLLQRSPDSSDKWQFGSKKWQRARRIIRDPASPGVREITVRSMMGSFGGNAGLLSAWFDDAKGEWRFEYDTCSLGVQHIWWAIHVIDIIALVCFVLSRFDTPSSQKGVSKAISTDKRGESDHTNPESKGPLLRTVYRREREQNDGDATRQTEDSLQSTSSAVEDDKSQTRRRHGRT